MMEITLRGSPEQGPQTSQEYVLSGPAGAVAHESSGKAYRSSSPESAPNLTRTTGPSIPQRSVRPQKAKASQLKKKKTCKEGRGGRWVVGDGRTKRCAGHSRKAAGDRCPRRSSIARFLWQKSSSLVASLPWADCAERGAPNVDRERC
jgi:hypothetical protein